MERKWIIAVVGDIRGFGAWTSRSSVTVEIQEQFILNFYRGMQDYVRDHLDVSFKYTGDGFQIVKEFGIAERKNGEVINFIDELRKIIKHSKTAIAGCYQPQPNGFRVRIFSGFVSKLMVLDPNDPDRKRLIPEFVGYTLNTAHRILGVNPEIACLCDGKLAAGRKKFFKMRPLGHPSFYPVGVDSEDVDGLKVIRL